MVGDRHRSVNSIYQRPCQLQEEAEGAVEGSDRRRTRTASHRRGPSPPLPHEELVQQTEEEEGPHEDDECEAAGTDSASSDSSSSVYLRRPMSLPQVSLPHQRPVIHPEGEK